MGKRMKIITDIEEIIAIDTDYLYKSIDSKEDAKNVREAIDLLCKCITGNKNFVSKLTIELAPFAAILINDCEIDENSFIIILRDGTVQVIHVFELSPYIYTKITDSFYIIKEEYIEG